MLDSLVHEMELHLIICVMFPLKASLNWSSISHGSYDIVNEIRLMYEPVSYQSLPLVIIQTSGSFGDLP